MNTVAKTWVVIFSLAFIFACSSRKNAGPLDPGNLGYAAAPHVPTLVPVAAPTSVPTPTPSPIPGLSRVVLGYYPDYDASNYPVADISYQDLTHIAHFAADPTNTGTLVNNTPIDNPALISTAHANGVRVVLCVGGWGWDAEFTSLAANATYRTNFVTSVVNLVQARGYDGVDIDWEFPSTGPDKVNFVLLSQELRAALDVIDPSLEMSFCVGNSYTFSGFDIPQLMPLYDYVCCMNYNYHGCWNAHAGHNAPLYGTGSCCFHTNSVSGDLQDWVFVGGVPREKLLMGLAFYGFKYDSTGSCGGDNSVCGSVKNRQVYPLGGYNDGWDVNAQVPYKYNAGSWISYSTPQSIALKCQHVIDQDYAGVLIWHIGADFYNNTQVCLNAVGDEF